MSTPESRLWDHFKRHLPITCMATRIETTTMCGYPDVTMYVNGRDMFIELKAHPAPLMLRKFQNAWAAKRTAMGGCSYVVWHNTGDNSLSLHKTPFTTTLCSKRDYRVVTQSVLLGIYEFDRMDSLVRTLINEHS